MNNKKKILFALGIIVVILLIIVIILELKKDAAPQVSQAPIVNNYIPDGKTASSAPRDWEETVARKEVPVGVKVPEPSDIIPDNLKNEIAVPSAAVSAGSSETKTAQIRIFKIEGKDGKFIPSKIIANYNDIVNIQFAAIDRDYDIVFAGYNIKQSAKQGQTSFIEFQALLDGRFPYYCVSCGGSETNYQGEIIIVK
ncbi:MAG: cupredoxin domain-containing protein [Patescibacteria group bacterium]